MHINYHCVNAKCWRLKFCNVVRAWLVVLALCHGVSSAAYLYAAEVAVERRSSPSDAPQGDWPCVVIGSGFTTQQRLRSPTVGVFGSQPLSLRKARETPSQQLVSCTLQSNPNRLRVQAPKSKHKHAVLRDLTASAQHRKLPLCAGAHRPPAHLTARLHALGMQAASTVSSRSAPARSSLTCTRPSYYARYASMV